MTNYTKKIIFLPIVSIILFGVLSLLIDVFLYKKHSGINAQKLETIFLESKKVNLKNEVHIVYNFLQNYSSMSEEERNDVLKNIRSLNKNSDEYVFVYKVDKDLKWAKAILVPNIGVRKEGMVLDLEDSRNVVWKLLLEKIIKISSNELTQVYDFKRPSTNKIEKKVAYFYFDKKNYLLIGKGIYVSDIKKDMQNFQHNDLHRVEVQIYYSVLLLIILTLIFTLISYKISKKITETINNYQLQLEYDNRYLEYRVEKQTEEVIKKYFYCDLTGLPNRNKLLKDLKYIKAVIMIDIDDFGAINDIYGIDFGNHMLKEFALSLDSYLHNATLYRVGSDEFLVSFKENIDLKTKIIEIEKFLELLEIKKDSVLIDLSVTIGASESEPLLESSDLSLRFAKTHKKPYVIYSEDLRLKSKEETTLSIVKTVKDAIREDRVVPFFQCIRDKDGHIVKYESLIRIVDKNKVISPYLFLEISKKAKLYTELTQIMIQKSLAYFKYRKELISINLSYEDIINPVNQDYILNILKEYNCSERVVIELLESDSLENLELVKEFIAKIKELDVKLAIDDFGAGYSNFAYLLSLEPDYIKIDGSIVKNIHQDDNAKLICKTITDFAKAKNIKTVAEFVHNEEVFNIAKELGIDEFQGFYFCEPKKNV